MGAAEKRARGRSSGDNCVNWVPLLQVCCALVGGRDRGADPAEQVDTVSWWRWRDGGLLGRRFFDMFDEQLRYRAKGSIPERGYGHRQLLNPQIDLQRLERPAFGVLP